jgi:hypothetical protein
MEIIVNVLAYKTFGKYKIVGKHIVPSSPISL